MTATTADVVKIPRFITRQDAQGNLCTEVVYVEGIVIDGTEGCWALVPNQPPDPPDEESVVVLAQGPNLSHFHSTPKWVVHHTRFEIIGGYFQVREDAEWFARQISELNADLWGKEDERMIRSAMSRTLREWMHKIEHIIDAVRSNQDEQDFGLVGDFTSLFVPCVLYAAHLEGRARSEN